MNREDIIQLMRDAGFVVGVSAEHWGDVPFAKLCHPTPTSSSLYRMLESLVSRVAAAEREKSLRLWMLLDDVDTADDIAKADHEVYRSLCRKAHQKRWEILSEAEVDAAIRARGNT